LACKINRFIDGRDSSGTPPPIQDEMRKLQKEPAVTFVKTIRAAGRRAACPFRQSTLKKLDEDVDEFRDNVSMALQVLQLKEHQNTQDDIEEMKRIIKNAQAQYLAASIRHWLRAPDATIDYNAACAKRHRVLLLHLQRRV
jgi:ankyrin repeat domain-containing protein 50